MLPAALRNRGHPSMQTRGLSLATGCPASRSQQVAAGRPLIAALVVSHRGDLPRQGFFDLAVELGRLPPDPAQHGAAYREEFARVMASRR